MSTENTDSAPHAKPASDHATAGSETVLPSNAPVPPARASTVRIKRNPKDPSYFWGTGRRKTSVARVRLKHGEGKFHVNGREYSKYFCVDKDRLAVIAPLEATGRRDKVDICVNVSGGGTTGQAGAIVMGVARALLQCEPDTEQVLRDRKFLSRDSRKVERKKYGQSGARRRFQFSKR